MSDRDVWIKAGLILSEMGEDAAGDYIVGEMKQVLDSHVAIADWRRVGAAIDRIIDTADE